MNNCMSRASVAGICGIYAVIFFHIQPKFVVFAAFVESKLMSTTLWFEDFLIMWVDHNKKCMHLLKESVGILMSPLEFGSFSVVAGTSTDMWIAKLETVH